jgi:hypothetical protein
MLARAAGVARPHRRKLRENPITELVAAAREGERRVRVQALEAARTGRAADPQGKLGSQRTLLTFRVGEAAAQIAVASRSLGPALDAAGRLQPGDRGDEEGTGQPERRREGRAAIVERRLLGDRGTPERAPRDDPAKRARRPSKLTFDYCPVIHLGRG